MNLDHDALVTIAQRIGEAENRVSQLNDRVLRLKSEGSDTSQAQEALQIVSRNLGNLYIQQSTMRRSAWAHRWAKAG
jgi:Flp pilus assembly secretin CpaC